MILAEVPTDRIQGNSGDSAMKKTLVALAVAAAVPAFAQAQTSIQLTGSVDVAVESLNKDANSSGKSNDRDRKSVV